MVEEESPVCDIGGTPPQSKPLDTLKTNPAQKKDHKEDDVTEDEDFVDITCISPLKLKEAQGEEEEEHAKTPSSSPRERNVTPKKDLSQSFEQTTDSAEQSPSPQPKKKTSRPTPSMLVCYCFPFFQRFSFTLFSHTFLYNRPRQNIQTTANGETAARVATARESARKPSSTRERE